MSRIAYAGPVCIALEISFPCFYTPVKYSICSYTTATGDIQRRGVSGTSTSATRVYRRPCMDAGT